MVYVVEWGHFIISEALVKACKGQITEWPKKLPEVMFADQITVSWVTGYSPFQLHATDPLLPLDIAETTFLVEEFRSGLTTEELLELCTRQLFRHPEDLKRAAETLWKAHFTFKKQFEKHFLKQMSNLFFNAGDLVLLWNTQVEMSHDWKHRQWYLGPY